MRALYFPGCTLKNKAADFDRSLVAAMRRLDVELSELPRWNCCGTVFSMTRDDLMLQLAPIRNLLRAEQQGGGELLVPCSMCYNTLVRAQRFLAEDPERARKVRDFMYDEASAYQGTVRVVHPLVFLRERLGWEGLRARVTRSLAGLKLAGYYGCLLVRPAEAAIDDPVAPRILEDFLGALGAEAVPFGLRTECCGSYQTLTWRAVTLRRTHEILGSAAAAGADALVTSCPLCAYNLDQMGREARSVHPGTPALPVLYFSEVLSLALGEPWAEDWTALHEVDPRPLLARARPA